MKKTIVLTSGGFDPVHKGHLEYLERASKLGDIHICIMNGEHFLINKKGYSFMGDENRFAVLSSLQFVDLVIRALDEDDTVTKTIKYIRELFPSEFYNMVFAKGGDRFKAEVPELELCKKLDIEIVDGLGEKIESSSSLVKQFELNKKNHCA